MKPVNLHFKANIYLATLYQWGVALAMLWLTRFIFIAVNIKAVDIESVGDLCNVAYRGLQFDIVATTYFNLLFLVMRIVPFDFVYHNFWKKASAWVYGVCNSIMLALSMADVPYYNFTGSRMRWATMTESLSDSNTAGILLKYVATYWWVVLAGIALIALMMWLYCRVVVTRAMFGARKKKSRQIVHFFAFLAMAVLCVFGLRGRPIGGLSLSTADAILHVNSSKQVGAVLNSPFTVIRTIGKLGTIPSLNFYSEDKLAQIRSSLHTPAPNAWFCKKNVMIIIIESGGSAFIDYLSEFPSGATRGVMPFLDSLAQKSLVNVHTMAIGIVSTGGVNAVLSSFPTFEPLHLMASAYASVPFDAPASLLAKEGYESVFYYGSSPGSFYIDQLAHASGFKRNVDRDTYPYRCDFDGGWGIFDEPMGQYIVSDLSKMQQPWIASWFTISAHGPFILPDDYDTSNFKFKDAVAQRGLEYTDVALREFFASASKQPWYDNTIFVITGDHGNRDLKGTKYNTPYIKDHIPFIVYTPDGSIPPRRIDDRVMAQFDIAPTLMSLLGFQHPYIALGTDLLDDSKPHYGLSGNDSQLMVTGMRYVIITDNAANNLQGVYDITNDPEMEHPLSRYDSAEVDKMLTWLRAFMQDYTTRLNLSKLKYGE